uniref:Putative secreted salivary gland peptide n=1 Tax=Ixodes ricinus TaxID=34613 RepID=A0A0K8R3V0_IXORI
MVLQIVESKEDFEKKLEEAGDKLVVVDFFATWCGPCKMGEPFLKQQSEILKDVVIFLKVDVDENEEITQEYEIACMPTFLFIKNKTREVSLPFQLDEISGANEESIKECWTSTSNPPTTSS